MRNELIATGPQISPEVSDMRIIGAQHAQRLCAVSTSETSFQTEEIDVGLMTGRVSPARAAVADVRRYPPEQRDSAALLRDVDLALRV